ncbi:MAG: DnaA regulatory inactivator Hda [Burkholderiales bacterium]|jgi:DnaA family protein|nr:DnaA regulatory inactivator Hda [Burkholderiales bacterium]
MKQLAFELASPPAPTLDNFVVGENAEVLAAVRALARGGAGERFVYLWGGSGSGRTHLLRAVLREWQGAGRVARFHASDDPPAAAAIAATDAIAVDDVQQLPPPAQIELFNIYNSLKESSGMLLVAGDVPPARLALRPDLLTRLAWGLVYEVRALSEDDRRAAVHSYARARGFELPAEVTDYLLSRAPRDLSSLRALVDTLDRLSLEQKRAITVPLARELLQAALPRN